MTSVKWIILRNDSGYIHMKYLPLYKLKLFFIVSSDGKFIKKNCKKELQADYVIVVMSGDYVQRGTPALLPKHLRAEMALRCGADLVLEMPVSVSTASAETFAMAGVSILDNTATEEKSHLPAEIHFY